MELMFRKGDYVSDGATGLQKVQGREELLQRVLFRLTARRGTFPLMESLGSHLWKLGQISPSARQTAAKQFVAEALQDESGLSVEEVTLDSSNSGVTKLTVQLDYHGDRLSVTLDIQ